MLLVGGCDFDDEDPIFMAPGSYGDIAVVVSSASLEGGVEQFIGQMNEEFTFVLSRESLFNIDIYPPDRWELAKGYKNIIVLWRVGDGGPVEKMLRGRLTDAGEARASRASGALIELEEPFASYQHALVLAASGRQELLRLLNRSTDDLRTRIEEKNQQRIMRRYRHQGLANDVMASLWRRYRFFMEIPAAYHLNQDSPDGYPGVEFMRGGPSRGITVAWSHSVDPGLLVGHRPLLVELRREMGLKMHDEEIVEDSLVWTQDRIGDQDVLRLEGAWNSTRFDGGGPFWSWFLADPANQRVICIDALCYAPGMDKMDFFRRMRAVVQTFTLERPQP